MCAGPRAKLEYLNLTLCPTQRCRGYPLTSEYNRHVRLSKPGNIDRYARAGGTLLLITQRRWQDLIRTLFPLAAQGNGGQRLNRPFVHIQIDGIARDLGDLVDRNNHIFLSPEMAFAQDEMGDVIRGWIDQEFIHLPNSPVAGMDRCAARRVRCARLRMRAIFPYLFLSLSPILSRMPVPMAVLLIDCIGSLGGLCC